MIDNQLLADYDESTRTLRLRGDAEEPERLVTLLRDNAPASGSDLVVDLSGVTFCPSTAISALVDARKAASRQGATLTLVSAEGTIARRILQVCGLPCGAA